MPKPSIPERQGPQIVPDPQRQTGVREMVGLFADPRRMEEAVEALLTYGFDHGDVTMLAGERTVRGRLGHRIDDSVAAADDPATPRRSLMEPQSRMEGRGALASVLGYLGAVTALGVTFASGGAATAAIGAALVGGGGGAAVGAGLGRLFERRLAREMARQIESGGILVWVRCRDVEDETRATTVLERYGAHHVHGLSLDRDSRQGG